MLVQAFCVSLAALSIVAIKVPVESNEEQTITTAQVMPDNVIPIYYASDGANIDSYLVPPDPNKPEEVDHNHVVPTPATYLLPPAPDSQNEFFYKPTEPGEQTDWYPIVATPQNQAEVIPLVHEDKRQKLQEINKKFRIGKDLNGDRVITVPSRNLIPPREDAPNEFVILSLSPDLELPIEEIDHTLNNPSSNIQMALPRVPHREKRPVNYQVGPELIPVSFITPPKNELHEYHKNPKRLYPKKFNGEFRPVPIPISQFAEESVEETPVARPVPHDDNEYTRPTEAKHNYLHEQTDRKRKLKKQHESDTASESPPPTEQEVSATNYRHPGREVYPERTNEEYNAVPKHKHDSKSKGERTEFRMHGMKGPHSYQFGYDTGKGKNRQFRYEERDNDGHVRGHYGYVDKFGKLRVVNYDADPEHGFRAEVPAEKQ